MKIFIDQLGNKVELSFPLRRIVSLVPSQTELLYDLGLRDEVVGITKFCVHPDEWFRTKTRVGGTKKLNVEKIISLHPDLIIANKEENTEAQIKELMQHFPVWTSNIQTVNDALAMMNSVGKIVGKENEAKELTGDIRTKLTTRNSQPTTLLSAAYFIWKDPFMVAGRDTFIHNMMTIAGFTNVFFDKNRYPTVSEEEIKQKQPGYLLLSSEPFPFKEKHLEEMQMQFPSSKLLLVDGEMFSWYGSRMRLAAKYFRSIDR